MKIVIILLSIVTTVSLFDELNEHGLEDNSSNADNSVVQLWTPTKESDPLQIEKNWIKPTKKNTKKRNKSSNNQNRQNKKAQKKVDATPKIAIGGVNYSLLGIFTGDETPFILLQHPNKKLLKVEQGKEISKGSTLKEINTDHIVINSNNEIIKFKLFERKKNA